MTSAFPVSIIAAVVLATSAAAQTPDPSPAVQHLQAARTALNAVLNKPATGPIYAKLVALRTEYLELERAYSARGDWEAKYRSIENILNELVPAANPPAPPPTSVDAETRTQLEQFRNELLAFRTAVTPSAPAPVGTTGTAAPATISASVEEQVTKILQLLDAAIASGQADRSTLESIRTNVETIRTLVKPR